MQVFSLNLNGKLLPLGKPIVMAIINVTPDSFHTSCGTNDAEQILQHTRKALSDGASILDLGAYSTRPGAAEVGEEEEWKRLSFALKTIRSEFPEAHISVDTFRANIARMAVEQYNVCMINDISGGTLDKNMFATIAELQVAYVLMHMKGTPQTMQQHCNYDDMMSEILDFFQKASYQLRQLGVKDIILDPGFGFAKNLEQNYELLHKMSYFHKLNLPILAGLSRKSMIYKLLDTTTNKALNGTTVVNTIAIMQGAHILRVHDVKEAVETVTIIDKYHKECDSSNSHS